jgi:hypothetical protein
MKTLETQPVIDMPFRLDSVTPVRGPDGDQGTWHRYVITQGHGVNTISGMRSGTLAEINIQLQQMVERLNERFGKQQAKLRGR